MSNEIGSRVRYSEAFWRAHHEAWQQSALNQREYCEAHGIPLKGNCQRSTAADEAEKKPPPRSYCRRTGRLSGPRKPNPCQRTLAGSGKVMLGKRSNSIGIRISPTVRRDRCAPAQ